jgi:hypothetical protein
MECLRLAGRGVWFSSSSVFDIFADIESFLGLCGKKENTHLSATP